jgi:hypothetical protein
MRWVEVVFACVGAAAFVATVMVDRKWGSGPAYALVAVGAICYLGVGLLRVRRA